MFVKCDSSWCWKQEVDVPLSPSSVLHMQSSALLSAATLRVALIKCSVKLHVYILTPSVSLVLLCAHTVPPHAPSRVKSLLEGFLISCCSDAEALLDFKRFLEPCQAAAHQTLGRPGRLVDSAPRVCLRAAVCSFLRKWRSAAAYRWGKWL